MAGSRKYDPLVRMGFIPSDADVLARLEDLENKRTIIADYWQNSQPVSPESEAIWYDADGLKLYIYLDAAWLEIPLSTDSVYIDRSTSNQYTWTGSAMVLLTFPLTKAAIEALLTGQITSHTHAADATKLDATKAAVEALIYTDKQTLAALNIDLATAEVFEKTLTGATAFTISNPRNFKPFRLILTGGSLSVPTFTGYTVNWINTSLVTDYVNTISNVLWCEIRSAGQIYCFWGN